MFKVMVYGYQCGIFSSRKLEEACRCRLDFRWLLENEKAPDHTTFARFRTGRCAEAELRKLDPQSFRWLMEGLKIDQPKAIRKLPQKDLF